MLALRGIVPDMMGISAVNGRDIGRDKGQPTYRVNCAGYGRIQAYTAE
jgi:hypothetical protein